MSLLNDFSRVCTLMNKSVVDDGEGGTTTTWTEGAEFLNCMTLNTSMEARVAEKQGVTSVYELLVDKDFPIGYGDYFKDVATQVTYRVTSNPEDKVAPKSSTLKLKYLTAERRGLPT